MVFFRTEAELPSDNATYLPELSTSLYNPLLSPHWSRKLRDANCVILVAPVVASQDFFEVSELSYVGWRLDYGGFEPGCGYHFEHFRVNHGYLSRLTQVKLNTLELYLSGCGCLLFKYKYMWTAN